MLLRQSLWSVFSATANLYTLKDTPTNPSTILMQYFSSKANTLGSVALMEFGMLSKKTASLARWTIEGDNPLAELGRQPELDMYNSV